VLSSGSGGNCALVRAGETTLIVDAGLTLIDLEARLTVAGIARPAVPRARGEHRDGALDHVLVTHGHLDHARSAGAIAKKHRARLHCAEAMMANASIRRARDLATLAIHATCELEPASGLRITPVALPHDADPTVAFKIEHGERTAVILTDMGRPDAAVARWLQGAHVLVLEFNHDLEMLRTGPYPPPLKARVAGDGGHLSNAQAQSMLRLLAGPNLHTLVLAHLSEKNNRPELALEAARATLGELGLAHVRVLVAKQDGPIENLAV
jgi:phosphoribosyl 1,2-cyclic phosphodiesterase